MNIRNKYIGIYDLGLSSFISIIIYKIRQIIHKTNSGNGFLSPRGTFGEYKIKGNAQNVPKERLVHFNLDVLTHNMCLRHKKASALFLHSLNKAWLCELST